MTLLHVRVDVDEWLAWARAAERAAGDPGFIAYMPDALCAAGAAEPVPFSTPRSWAQLSRALDLAEAGGVLTRETRRALAFGRLSAGGRRDLLRARRGSDRRDARRSRTTSSTRRRCRTAMRRAGSSCNCIRQQVRDEQAARRSSRARSTASCSALPHEHQLTLLADLVDRWGALGADDAMLGAAEEGRAAMNSRRSVTGRRDACCARIERGLRMVTVPFPHLAGLAAATRVTLDEPPADDGRVRVGPAGREPGLRRAG